MSARKIENHSLKEDQNTRRCFRWLERDRLHSVISATISSDIPGCDSGTARLTSLFSTTEIAQEKK